MAKAEQIHDEATRQFFLEAIGTTVDADSIGVLHATTMPCGTIVALLRLAGGSHAGDFSCVLSEDDLAKVLRSGRLRPALAH